MKKILPIIIIIIIVGCGAFFGGMKYEQSKSPLSGLGGQNLQDLSPEQRQQFFQGSMGGNLPERAGRGEASSFLNGEVIDKDEQSLTLKMPDGGSRIVFFSDSTEISKTTEGLVDDVEIGKQIMISGEQNSDGSYSAKTIQIRL